MPPPHTNRTGCDRWRHDHPGAFLCRQSVDQNKLTGGSRSQRQSRWSIGLVLLLLQCTGIQPTRAAPLHEAFEGPAALVSVSPAPGLRLVSQGTETAAPHTGNGCESLVLETTTPLLAQLQVSLPQAAVIDEFSATLWVRCEQPGVRLASRVLLPATATATGRPLEVIIPGPPMQTGGRWQPLTVAASVHRSAWVGRG